MLFGDARKMVEATLAELRNLASNAARSRVAREQIAIGSRGVEQRRR